MASGGNSSKLRLRFLATGNLFLFDLNSSWSNGLRVHPKSKEHRDNYDDVEDHPETLEPIKYHWRKQRRRKKSIYPN